MEKIYPSFVLRTYPQDGNTASFERPPPLGLYTGDAYRPSSLSSTWRGVISDIIHESSDYVLKHPAFLALRPHPYFPPEAKHKMYYIAFMILLDLPAEARINGRSDFYTGRMFYPDGNENGNREPNPNQEHIKIGLLQSQLTKLVDMNPTGYNGNLVVEICDYRVYDGIFPTDDYVAGRAIGRVVNFVGGLSGKSRKGVKPGKLKQD